MTRPAPIIVGTLAAILLLFGAYMGSYYAMLTDPIVSLPELDEHGNPAWDTVMPGYRLDGRRIQSLYFPAHQLDRLIRPGYWGDE